MCKFILLISCLSLILVFTVSAQTDSFLKNYQELIEKNPASVDFTISFKNSQTQFRQGEIIPVELKFTTSTPNLYNFLNRTYDRGGRLHLDGFIIDKKEKTYDPLYDYFYRGEVFSMGGMYTVPTLGSSPQIINYELNEFLSFKEVGKYRLYIISPRVSLKKEEKNDLSAAFGGSSISLSSNIVEFEILPADEKWQEEKFAEAEKNCKILRYLGTKAAAKEMLVHFSRSDKTCEFDNYIGLYGSPERKFIVEEMEKMLVSPDYAVTNEFFQTLLRLDYFLSNSESKNSESNYFSNEEDIDKKIKNAIKLKYLEIFSKALANKNEISFETSLETFFSFHAEGEKMPPSKFANALIKNFSNLLKRTQRTILQNSLDKLKTPAMLPVLQAIYNNVSRDSPESGRFGRETFEDYYNKDLLNLSIKGIYELDQNIGKQIILNELRLPKQKVYTSVLELLPKTESPEVENLLLEKLNGNNIPADDLSSVFELVDNYETPKLISNLRENYATRIDIFDCGAKIEFLKIFLKSDINFGEKLLDKTIKSDIAEGCIGANLANVLNSHWSPEIERVVLQLLEDNKSFISYNAVKMLGKYGSIDTRDKIWKRFERFNKEELSKKDLAEEKENFSSLQTFAAESDFVQALSESPNWFFNRQSNQRAAKLCLYDYCKETTEKLNKIFNAPAKIETSIDGENKISFSVYQYQKMSLDELKKKLAQFPPDTLFTWISNTKNPNDEKHFLEIKNFVQSKGMKLAK